MTIHLTGTIADTYVTGACGAFEPANITGETSVVDCKVCRNTHRFRLLSSRYLERNPIVDQLLNYRRGPLVSSQDRGAT